MERGVLLPLSFFLFFLSAGPKAREVSQSKKTMAGCYHWFLWVFHSALGAGGQAFCVVDGVSMSLSQGVLQEKTLLTLIERPRSSQGQQLL